MTTQSAPTQITPANSLWTKSSYSGGTGNCVEMRVVGTRAQVRDSKRADQQLRAFPHTEMTAFLRALTSGTLTNRSRT